MIKIIVLGKTKEKYLKSGIDDFINRINHFHKIEYVVLKDRENINEEGKEILERIDDEFVIVLDVFGKDCSSRLFAELIKKECIEEGKKLVFILGSETGLSEDVKKKANLLLSLSKMTFTHEMARLILLEQIYRAFNIIKGTGYHK
ncbi:23S rRNA (pseudouridine(1915)-N(3))-methyltransferase RlmH [Candidatus Woesearchaeota archaeon]|nr:23S rRNA (pseudouridine(1915)-N(3))-methyltransferase RlmH [Candidatus Woesearchaeota archaeon]